MLPQAARNKHTGEKVAIKHIDRVFADKADTVRIIRELRCVALLPTIPHSLSLSHSLRVYFVQLPAAAEAPEHHRGGGRATPTAAHLLR